MVNSGRRLEATSLCLRCTRLAGMKQLELVVEVKRVTVGVSEFLATESGLAVVAQGVTQEISIAVLSTIGR